MMKLTIARMVSRFNLFGAAIMMMIVMGKPIFAADGTIAAQNSHASLVSVVVDGKTRGSGFLINTKGDVVTNYHLVRDSKNISISWKPCKNIKQIDYTSKEILVKAVNPVYDLAILHITPLKKFPEGLQPVKINTGKIEFGTSVYAMGYPKITELKSRSFTDGMINGINTANTLFPNRFAIEKRKNSHELLRTNAITAEGSSGGMLLDSNGDVIAVTTGAVADGLFGFAVPIEYVNELLEKKPEQLKAALGYPWEKYNIKGDKYYTLTLYSETKERENILSISGYVLDQYCETGIRTARVWIEFDGQDDREYKRLIYTGSDGRYEVKLPGLSDPKWYITVEHDDYTKSDRLGPFTDLEEFPKQIHMVLRDELRKNVDVLLILDPSQIGLNKHEYEIKFSALVYMCKEPTTDNNVSWIISASDPAPEWLIYPRFGEITSGEFDIPIKFTFHKEAGLSEEEVATAHTTLRFSSLINDHIKKKRSIVVYADKLPKTRRRQISGYLITEDDTLVDKPIRIRAKVDGKFIFHFNTISRLGYFEAFVDQDLENKDIRLHIPDNNMYMVDKKAPSLIVNKEKDWHTVITLKKKK